MNTELLYQLIQKKDDVKAAHQTALKDIINDYPFFQAAIFLYLKSLYLYDMNLFNEELKRLSISVDDRKKLFYFIFSEEYDNYFIKNQKSDLSEDKTRILLNAFFENYKVEETMELEYNLAHTTLASSDYFSYIGETTKKEVLEPITSKSMSQEKMIDNFIQKSGTKKDIQQIQLSEVPENKSQSPLPENESLDDDIFFTETLAKIYIKQKRYDKAYKIIKHLSLNFPKKNVYFADQLSFLEKLIINSKFKDKK